MDRMPSMQAVQKLLATSEPENLDVLADDLGCSREIAACLLNRGIDAAPTATQYLDPPLADLHDPSGLV